MEPGPSTSEEKFVKRILPSDDETASNSSGGDFEPVQKRFSTPRRQLRSSTVTEKRITRSSAKIPEKIVEEVDESCSCGTTEDEGEEKECDDPVDPMESCTATTTLPDPPSPLLLDGLCEKEARVSDHSGVSLAIDNYQFCLKIFRQNGSSSWLASWLENHFLPGSSTFMKHG